MKMTTQATCQAMAAAPSQGQGSPTYGRCQWSGGGAGRTSRSSAASPRLPSPAMTSDQPSKMRSIPTNVPITQRADTGHSAAMIAPSATVTMPLATAQPPPRESERECRRDAEKPADDEERCHEESQREHSRSGVGDDQTADDERQHPAEQMARESAPPADAPRVDRLEDSGDAENPPENEHGRYGGNSHGTEGGDAEHDERSAEYDEPAPVVFELFSHAGIDLHRKRRDLLHHGTPSSDDAQRPPDA
jgi:hypothetical protein